jgi:hypothetical protein
MLTVMLERRSSKQSQGTFEGEIHMTRARVANERCHVVLLLWYCYFLLFSNGSCLAMLALLVEWWRTLMFGDGFPHIKWQLAGSADLAGQESRSEAQVDN